MVEKGPLGSNVGRNTTIVRSNYFHPANIRFYELSLQLWERFEQTVNFNAMVSQRGTSISFTPRRSAICSCGARTRCACSAWTQRP